MATKRELKRDVDAVARPPKMAVSDALAISDPDRALLAVYNNVDHSSPAGETISWAYEAMLKVNSSGLPMMFLEWSPREVTRARAALLEVRATEAASTIDKVFEHLELARDLDELPVDALDLLLSNAFEQWKRASLPEPPALADRISDQIRAYVERNVEQL